MSFNVILFKNLKYLAAASHDIRLQDYAINISYCSTLISQTTYNFISRLSDRWHFYSIDSVLKYPSPAVQTGRRM